jgi:hypothetical protein
VATPFASVVTVAVAEGGVVAKMPLAPVVVAGAANVTVTPLFGVPPVVTVATSAAANAAPATALCGVPLVAAIDSTGVAVFVRLKLAGVEAPGTEAVTT